jgi:hypothetical protein
VAAAFALVPLFAAIPLGRFADRRGAPLLTAGAGMQALACRSAWFSISPLGSA